MKTAKDKITVLNRSNRIKSRLRLLFLISFLLILLSSVVHAQSGGGYDLSWNTVDGGGGMLSQGGGGMLSQGGGYSINGTAGQADAGYVEGGAYALAGGFLPGGEVKAATRFLYMPVMMLTR